MSSVVSYKTNATNQGNYSRISDSKSAAGGYSRGASAYSQRNKNLLEQEHKKEVEDLLQKQIAEQERHKRLMLENKQRAKMHKEQLRKELEAKREQEEEYLRKMKEDKKSAYIKYLKENSKELLQNFKKKEQTNNPDAKKPVSMNDLANKKGKSTSAESAAVGKGQKPSAGNMKGNNKAVLPKITEGGSKNTESDEQDNLNALDLDISRSTNNFRRILDQYHKEMEQLHEIKKAAGEIQEKMERNAGIPLQKFYDDQNNHRQVPQSKLLESLDLTSSIANYNPMKANKEKENNNKNKFEPADDYEEDEQEEEEVEENIEVNEDDDEEENKVQKSKHGGKKLTKITDISQKQKKNDWYLGYIDKQSQVKSNPTTKTDVSARSNTGVLPQLKNVNPKSLDCIPNYEQTPVSEQLGIQKKNENIVRDVEKNSRTEEDEHKFYWADDVKEDDFYKGLSQQVAGPQGGMVAHKNLPVLNKEVKPQNPKVLTEENLAKINRNNVPVAAVSSKSQVPEKEKVPLAKKKAPSVTSIAKKSTTTDKENRGVRRISGAKSKVENQPNLANQQVNKAGRKVGKVTNNKRMFSPGTKGTRETDLDVEEFLKDDFNMLNQEERAIQEDIVKMHRNQLGKVREFEKKHNINTQYQNTQQLINKNVTNIPFSDKVIDEDDLEQSLDRLDVILAKHRAGAPVNQAIPGYGQQQQPQPQVHTKPQYQAETSLFQQVMNTANDNNMGLYNQGQSYNIYKSNPTNPTNPVSSGYNYPNYEGGYPTGTGSGYIGYMPQQSGQVGNQMDYQIGVVSPEFGQKVNQAPGSYYPQQQGGMSVLRPQNMNVEGYSKDNQGQGGSYSRNALENKNNLQQQQGSFRSGMDQALERQEEMNKGGQEKISRHILKKMQQNQYKINKPVKEEEHEEDEENARVVANTNLKHLLLGE